MHSPDPKWIVVIMATFFLVSCAAVATPPVKMLPPVELVQDCPAPTGSASTNGLLASWLNDFRAALAKCNIDKASLRDWMQQ